MFTINKQSKCHFVEKTDDQEIRILPLTSLTPASQRHDACLDLWQQPLSTTKTPMIWMMDDMSSMDHSQMTKSFIPGAYMPGMATSGEMQTLAEATEADAEQLFLELMIRHHQGGVMMADGVIKRSDNETVTRLAQTMVNGQQAEIDYMNELLTNY